MTRPLLFALLFFGISCVTPERIGGPCKYVDIPGVVTITSIETADTSSYNCHNAVEVLFDFVPDDTTAPQRYRFPVWPDTSIHLVVGAGMNPAREWITVEEISVGKTYDCLRREIISGACTPVIFDIVGIDFSEWADYCF